MRIRDAIYGDFELDSPVLRELLACPAMRRLSGIAQYGLPDELYYLRGYSRLDHSIGVMRLLQLMGAGEEEQAAGLLHDVSHAAFSHLVDWVLGDSVNEDWQDRNHARMIRRTEIPGILQRHGYDIERVTDETRFGLLERDAPDLCADRLDYALRELGGERARPYVRELANHQGRIVFTDRRAALGFARDYLGMQMEHWGGFEAVARYDVMARLLRYAMRQRVISFDDLLADDAHVIGKLDASRDGTIGEVMALLRTPDWRGQPRATEATPKKFRHVDPLVLADGTLSRLAELDTGFAAELEGARRRNARGMASIRVPALE